MAKHSHSTTGSSSRVLGLRYHIWLVCWLLFFLLVIPFVTSQMISHFLATPPQIPHSTSAISSLHFTSMRVLPHPPTLSRPTASVSAYAGASILYRTKGLLPLMSVRQGHPLLHMYMEPWIPHSTPLGQWSSPWEHWVVWPANIVLPMGLQLPSAPPVLLTAPPLGSLSSV